MKIDRIKEKLNNLVTGIANAAIDTKGRVPKFWQLYLDAEVGSGLEMVDTCATSQCLSVLAKAHYNDFELINNALSSVVRLRNNQGSWPSAITVDELKTPENRRQGDTAIGDNCFALTALIDAGFLSETFCYDSLLSEDLKNLCNRIKFVFQAVNWLLENKANDNVGWYYTDNKSAAHASVTLTTINVLQVLSKIIFELNKCCEKTQLTTEQVVFKQTILSELEEIVKILTDRCNIYDDIINDRKAIGTSVQCTVPSIIHTCKLVNLILYNKKYNGIDLYFDVDDLVNYIIDNTKSMETFRAQCKDFYFEQYDLHKLNDLGLSAPTTHVDHENFAEGIVLDTLIEIRLNNYSVQNDVIENMRNALIEHMDTSIPNFYKCRSERAREKNCWCPVYASYDAYIALDNYINSLEVASPEDATPTNIVDSAIEKVKSWVDQHSSGDVGIVLGSEDYRQLIQEFDRLTPDNDDDAIRVNNAKAFLRQVQSQNLKINSLKADDFLDFIEKLANKISNGDLNDE